MWAIRTFRPRLKLVLYQAKKPRYIDHVDHMDHMDQKTMHYSHQYHQLQYDEIYNSRREKLRFLLEAPPLHNQMPLEVPKSPGVQKDPTGSTTTESVEGEAQTVWRLNVVNTFKNLQYLDSYTILQQGLSKGYHLSAREARSLTLQACYHKKFQYALLVFLEHEPHCGSSRRVVSAAVTSAYKSGNHELCQSLFGNYTGKLRFSVGVMEKVLASFLTTNDIPAAKEFLYQIWDIVTEHTVVMYMQQVSKRARNGTEIESVYRKWVSHCAANSRQVEDHVTLVALCEVACMGNWDQFESMYKTAKTVSPSLKLKTLRALLREEQQEVTICLAKADCRCITELIGVEITERVLLHFAIDKRSTAYSDFVISLVKTDAGLTVNMLTTMMDHLMRVSPSFDVVKFISKAQEDGKRIPLRAVVRSLVRRYPDLGHAIENKVNGIYKTPQRQQEMVKAFVKMRERAPGKKLKHHLVTDNPEDLAHIQVHIVDAIRHLQPKRAVDTIEFYIRRGNALSKRLFLATIYYFTKFKNFDEALHICKLMAKLGYFAEIETSYVKLASHIDDIHRADESLTFDSHRNIAKSLIQFHQEIQPLPQYNPNISLWIARDLESYQCYLEAIRVAGTASTTNQATVALVLRCLLKLKLPQEYCRYLALFLDSHQTGAPIIGNIFTSTKAMVKATKHNPRLSRELNGLLQEATRIAGIDKSRGKQQLSGIVKLYSV